LPLTPPLATVYAAADTTLRHCRHIHACLFHADYASHYAIIALADMPPDADRHYDFHCSSLTQTRY
jgi:hypothetical protein